jgi:outer membrane protein OmpA-like peptidoglycan-associated protein
MKGYKLTGRGWALVVVLSMLLSLGAYSLVSLAFGNDNDNGSPPNHIFAQPSETPGSTPPPSGETSRPPSDDPDYEPPGFPDLEEPRPQVDWTEEMTTVMFAHNSSEMTEPVQFSRDLADMLPPIDELGGYLVIVESYTATGEDRKNLAEMRAEAVYDMLLNLEVPAQRIRTYANNTPAGSESYRQRAVISFAYAGDK